MVMQSDVTLMLGWQTFQIMVHPRTVSVGHGAAVCKPGVAQTYQWDVDDFRLVPLRLPPALARLLPDLQPDLLAAFLVEPVQPGWWPATAGAVPQLYLCSLVPRLQPLTD